MNTNKIAFILILIIVIVVIVGESPSLKDKIAPTIQNIRLKIITKDMQVKKIDNITYYSNKNEENYINTIKEYIKEGEEKTSPLLGQTTMYPLNIIMFTTPEAFGKVFKVNPKESLAVTILNSIYAPYKNVDPYVFVHEYTNYKINSFCIVNRLSIFEIPIWFKEGVAEYASSTLLPKKFKSSKLQEIQDFRKLDTQKQMLESWDKGHDTYMQSYIVVKKIIELKGEDSVQQILINTKSMTFYNAFEKVVGVSIEDFQKLLLTN